ncbi:MAG: 30S ribosomal protein S1 [Deltaproteobacteria bacterium]|nr:30S ribosomal protein S1 [Deltaproteobacteria bacterium]
MVNDISEDTTQTVSMEHADVQIQDTESEEYLNSMYEESFKRFREGEIVTGKVVTVSKDYVLVDIGYKSEGQIPIHEFADEQGNINIARDDSVEVLIDWWDDEHEIVNLSREKAEKVKVWEEIKKIYEDAGTINGLVTTRVKGGFTVDVGVQAFLPGSQTDIYPVHDPDKLVGQSFDFEILKYSQKRNNIVLSRRSILERERDAARNATLASIEAGKNVSGLIKNITEYGVFIDLGGVDGLLHITDISWGRVKHPSEIFSIGDEVEVKILAIDEDKKRVSLGRKQLTPDPWTGAEDKYKIGEKVAGKVISLTDYGAFVELEEGVEGLIHVSEMSWTKKIRHPSKIVSVGDIVESVVLDMNVKNRRISLGLKQAAENPWEVIEQTFPIGTTIEGKIKNITDFGVFIGIDNEIDGLVHISDISWTKRIKHPSEIYKKGDTVQAIVLDIDKNTEKFALGIKQLTPDPWSTVSERYGVGNDIEGVITNVTDFGVFVELEEGIEGLIHVSEISEEKINTPVGLYNIGDAITSRVMNVNSDERRIGLSIKRVGLEGAAPPENYHMDNNKTNYTSSLGQAFADEMNKSNS